MSLNGLSATTSFAILALSGVFGFASGGCQNKLHDENVALWNQNRELQSRLSDDDSRLRAAPDPAQLSSMQGQIAERDQQIADLKAQLQKQPAGAPPDPSLAGIEVTRDERAGTLTVNLPGDVLFAPGHADLKESSKSTLTKIVNAVQKNYPNKQIYVDGYSDSDPINRTKDKWQDNLDLSAARARSVAQYLVSQGIPSHYVAPRAFGATNPKANKAASRRVEIVVSTR